MMLKNIYIKYLHYKKCKSAWKKINTLELSNYLEPGEYQLNCNGRILLIKNDIPEKFVEMVCRKTGKRERRTLRIEEYFSGKALFHGQLLMLTAGGYRYFDYKGGKSLKLYDSEVEYEHCRHSYTIFSEFFKTTYISFNDGYSLEKIINHYPRKFWSNVLVTSNFFKIADDYIQYLSCSKGDIKKMSLQIEIPKNDMFPHESRQLLNDILQNVNINDEIPYIYCHCDLHFDNTLLDDNQLYLIDFDYAGKEIFFYDFFNVMYVEYVDRKNTILLDMFLSEDANMMNTFNRVFNAVGEIFDISKKKKYFMQFLLVRYNRFVLSVLDGKSGMTKNGAIGITLKIRQVFDYVKSYYEYEL